MADMISLDSLPLADGLRFGRWTVWHVNPSPDVERFDYLFIHLERGWAVRLAVMSNGWFDYRIGVEEWLTAYSDEHVERDAGRFENEVTELISREPAGEFAPGLFGIGGWRFDILVDRIVIRHRENAGAVVLHRDRDLWTWCKKVAPGRDPLGEDPSA